MSVRTMIKRKNSISNGDCPIAINWDVQQKIFDIDETIHRDGRFNCFSFGEGQNLTLYAHDTDTKKIDFLIKELTDFKNVILKGK